MIQVVWVRFVGHFLLTFALFAPFGLQSLIFSKRFGHQIMRSILMFIVTALNFLALKYLNSTRT